MAATGDATSARAGLDPAARVAPDHFKGTMSRFCTGVAAVSAMLDGRPVGMTCQSFVSLSIDPPLISISPSRDSSTYPSIRQAGRFAVSVLAEHQAEVAMALARKGDEKFADISWHPAESGAPVIDDCLAWVDCVLEAEYDAGDHFLVVARVLDLGHAPEGIPLTYFRSSFNTVGSR